MPIANIYKMGGAIALLASTLAISPSASALSYTFSFSSVSSPVSGTVQGTIVLPNGNGSGIAATSVVITSAPVALGYTLPFNATTNFSQVISNSFQVANGNIVLAGSSLAIQNPTTFTLLALNFNNGNLGSLLAISGNSSASSGVQNTNSSTLTFALVPFEFNPAIGLGFLGAVWLGYPTIKKAKSKNI